MQVLVRDNNVDQALKALKKKMQREGIFREMSSADITRNPLRRGRARRLRRFDARASSLARNCQRRGPASDEAEAGSWGAAVASRLISAGLSVWRRRCRRQVFAFNAPPCGC